MPLDCNPIPTGRPRRSPLPLHPAWKPPLREVSVFNDLRGRWSLYVMCPNGASGFRIRHSRKAERVKVALEMSTAEEIVLHVGTAIGSAR